MPITIGQAARRSGLSSKAIRLYEARGLLEIADRTPSGYRTYTDDDVAVLRFVRQAKSLDLSLDEIRDVIDLQRGGAQPCQTVLGLLERHITHIDRHIADLRALRTSLVRARSSAKTSSESGEDAVVCQIVESQTKPPADSGLNLPSTEYTKGFGRSSVSLAAASPHRGRHKTEGIG